MEQTESGPKMVSEREAVKRERAAFERGFKTRSWELRLHVIGAMHPNIEEQRMLTLAAQQEYPLPQIRRPRVVADPEEGFSQQWRVVDGAIEFKSGPDYGRWEKATFATGLPGGCMTPTNARIRMWAKLLEEPFELVDDDGGDHE